MNNHTPTPWVNAPQGMIVSMHESAADSPKITECNPANARRIVACVNACAPVLDVEDLESGRFVFGNLRDLVALQKECDEAKSMRAELLAALQKASKKLSDAARKMKWVDISAAQAMLRSADEVSAIVAKAKGGAA